MKEAGKHRARVKKQQLKEDLFHLFISDNKQFIRNRRVPRSRTQHTHTHSKYYTHQ